VVFILISLVVWLPAIIGLGSPLLVIRRNMIPRSDSLHLIFVALIGLATLGTIANLLNLFFPINPTVALIIFFSGWLLFILNARHFVKAVSLSLIIFGAILAIYIAYSSRRSVAHYDSGLYHLQAIRWITESKTPLGLANLHARLGFNSLWFSIAAALEIPPLQDKSSFVLNPMLLFIYGLAIGVGALNFRHSKNIALSEVFLLLTGLVWLIFTKGPFVSSPNTDFPVMILTLLLTFTSIKTLESREGWVYYSFVAIFMAILAITIKLSAIPLLLMPIMTLSWNLYRYRGQWDDYKSALITFLRTLLGTASLLLVPWIMRGILTSGCVAFPISFGCFPSLDWAVPISSATNSAVRIKSWARQPRVNPEVVLADWNWLISWSDRFIASEVVIKTASLLFFGLVLLWIAAGEKKVSFKDQETYILPALTLVLGIMFWFFTAPAIRFGEGYFWSLGLLIFSSGIYMNYVAYQAMRFNRILLIACVIIILTYAKGLKFINRQELYTRRQEILLSWPAIPTAEVEERFTKDGVRILSPTSGDQCWNASLPCTPYFNANLKVTLGETGLPEGFQMVTLVDR